MFNGRRQPSCGGTSRMTRECQVRICERLGVKFPGPTRQEQGTGSVDFCASGHYRLARANELQMSGHARFVEYASSGWLAPS